MTDVFTGPGDAVPFLSQHDEQVAPESRHEFCGLVSLYMVMAYWQQQRDGQPISVGQLSEYARSMNGLHPEYGWIHTKLAKTARHFGHEVIVRSWFGRDSDIAAMQEQERLTSEAESQRYVEQIQNEFLYTLTDLLSGDVPLIWSVAPGFGRNGTHHLIVLTGIDYASAEILIHDPQHTEETGKNMAVSTDTLLQYSNFNAIVVYDERI